MATERQIAANQRNARQSTGPRSRAGKKRAGQNAVRHGLTVRSSAAFAKQIERLARRIAGQTTNRNVLEHARDAALATIDLVRIRRVKVALIERASALDVAQLFKDVGEIRRFLRSTEQGKMPDLSKQANRSATLLPQGQERTAEAVRRALPELAKLDRYESRAAARRDRAIREIGRSR
jgi:hypothetical protein